MIIRKRNRAQKEDAHWHSFAWGLGTRLFSDYISLKLNHVLEPITLSPSKSIHMVELVEKSLKLYLSLKEQKENSLSYFSSVYGHNIEKLRMKASEYDEVFNQEDIKEFTSVFDDKKGSLFQKLRYGSQTTVEGFKIDIYSTIIVCEKFFFYSVMNHDEKLKKMINHNSVIYNLIVQNNFDQSKNSKLLLDSIRLNNPFFNDYQSYCSKLDKEDKLFLEKIANNKSQ
jgi:hypothetical protein